MRVSAGLRRMMTAVVRSILVGAALTAGVFGAIPTRAADFYEGKTLTVIVGFAPGGGVDANARAITRHLGRFIPGKPNVVVQNMEGAAGILSVNHMRTRVAADGLTLAVPGRSWYIEAIVKRSAVMPDPTTFTYIGSPGPLSATGFVHKRTGIDSLAALKAATKPVIFGGLGATTPTAMGPALLAAAGYPAKVVLGYVSTARVLLALEQGEVEGTFTVGNGLAARAELYSQVTPIVQTAAVRPGIPLLRDVVLERHRPVADLVAAPDELGLVLVGPAGIPADVTAILRQAFLDMSKDPDYMADAVKVELPVGDPIEGGRLARMMQSLSVSTTPEVIAEFARLSTAR